MLNRRLEKGGEERVWGKRAGLEFRMELRAEKEWVDGARKLCDFHKHAVERFSGKDEAGFFELRNVVGVHFVAVAMTLADFFLAVGFVRNRSLLEMRGVCTETHGRAVLSFRHMLFLLGHDVNDGVR